MILEVAHLDVKLNETTAFEAAFQKVSPLIAATRGYIAHELRRCIETPNRYVLFVQWETLDAHTIDFRQSERYAEWKNLLHHFYDPFPLVEHYEAVFQFNAQRAFQTFEVFGNLEGLEDGEPANKLGLKDAGG